MDNALKQLLDNAIEIAASLFERGKTSGSSANMSLRYQETIYITRSGSSFRNLTYDDFVIPNKFQGRRPSKELPLHETMYTNPSIHAVIHTHSFYSTLWSCLMHQDSLDIVPSYTPYLTMQLGKIKEIPYHNPGSIELFTAFKEAYDGRLGLLLKNHGPIVGHETLEKAFNGLEELEESCKIAWHLKEYDIQEIQNISLHSL